MAKDKGTKKNKAVTDDDFAKPSEAPAGGDGWSLTDGDKPKSGSNDGELFLITPLREEEHDDKFSKTPGAVKKHIVCDVVHLNEKKPAKSVEHEDTWVFGGWLMGALRAYIGERRVLGRLAKVADKTSGTGYVWKLEDADADDVQVARDYLASLDPFATKKAAKSEPEEKPAKKSKKAAPEPEPKAGKKKAKK